MVCFLGTNAFPTMAPWGGKDVKIGNNPIGLGAPRRDAPPFILDIAMSVAARGKMRKAAEKGERIPPGWALDKDGNPTTDPNEGLNGYVLPIGGHKGYGIALAVDILAGVLVAEPLQPRSNHFSTEGASTTGLPFFHRHQPGANHRHRSFLMESKHCV